MSPNDDPNLDAPAPRPPQSHGLEALPIGSRIVLRNTASGAIVLSDANGLKILEGVVRDRGLDAIAGELAAGFADPAEALRAVLATLRHWDEAGLWGAAASARPPPPAPPVSADAAQAVFRLGAHGLRLVCADRPLFDDIAALMSPYRGPGSGAALPTLALGRTTQGYLVALDDRVLWREATADEARFLVLQAAQTLLLGPGAVSTILHAAAVIRDGQALLLAGASGRGKTTLALRLVEEGWSFAGDDLVALAADGRSLLPLGFAANCKSREALHRLGWLWRSYARTGRPGGLVWPEPRAPAGRAVPVAGLVFPRYSQGTAFMRARVTPERALVHLLTTGTEVVGAAGSLEPLTALLNAVPIETWHYGETGDAVRAARDFLSPLRPR